MSDLNQSLASLKAACDQPASRLRHYLSQGKKVVGCFPPYAPEELIHAAGIIPMGLWGGRTELKLSKSYLPAFACPIMQADMEFGLNGAYQGLSAVIIPAMCDTLRCMTQNWRYGVKDIPMIPIVYPQNRTSPASVDYLISEFETVNTMLYTITGQMMSEDALCRSIQVYNEHNAMMRQFDVVANDHLDVITPRVRHIVHKSAFFYEKGEHIAILRSLIQELERRPVYPWPGKKVLLAGIMCEPEEILEILEENQIAVVADDLAQESRQYRTDTPLQGGGGLKRLALQWNLRHGCSLIHQMDKPRGSMMIQMCQTAGAQGVISCMMKFCDPEEYDQPFYETELKNAGYPCLSIDIDPQDASFEQVRTRIQTYSEML